MTKTEQTRLKTWRLKVLQHAGERSRNVARTCRHFGISRQAPLCDRAERSVEPEGKHRVALELLVP